MTTSSSSRRLSPTFSSRLFHRGPLRRLADLIEESADRDVEYEFANLLLKIRPSSPEWLARTLARLAERGVVSPIFRVIDPQTKVGLGDFPSLAEVEVTNPFTGQAVSVRLRDIKLLFRFHHAADQDDS